MVKIRLTRTGRRNLATYRIVVVDSRKRRDGAFIERLGYYQPINDPAVIEINEERALYWLSVGAQPSPTVKNLFNKKGINAKHHEKKNAKAQKKA